MRRILWMAAVGVLVLAMAAPAMALDFKFGGLARTRFYDHTAVGFDDNQATNPGNNVRGGDMLFRARFDASDDNGNIVSVIRLRIGKIVFGAGGGTENPVQFAAPAPVSTFNGAGFGKLGFSSGGGLGTRGTNEETEWAYLDFALPFNIPLRIRGGLQPIYSPKGLIIDDNAAGLRAYGSVAPFSYEVSWWRFDSGNNFGPSPWINGLIGISGRYKTEMSDNSYDVYGARLDLSLAPYWNTGLYTYYGDNRVNCAGTSAVNTPCPSVDRVRPNWYLGWTNTGQVGIVKWDFDFVYGWAKGGSTGNFVSTGVPGVGYMNTAINGLNNLPPITVRGFVVDGAIHFPVGPVTLHFGGSYATGDDQQEWQGHNSPAYPGGYSPSWKGPMGATEIIGDAGSSGFDVLTSTQSVPTNLWTLGVYATYNPVKALTLKALYAFAGFSNKKGNCAMEVIGSNACYGPAYMGGGFKPDLLAGSVLFASNGPGTQDGVATGATSTTVVQGTGGLAGSSTLGSEFLFQAFYNVWTNFNINGMMGWFVPTHGDTAGKYMLNFVYSF